MIRDRRWDRRFLDLARLTASWSKDPSTKVGAVITDAENRVVSGGYNGFPRGVIDDPRRLADRDLRLKMTIHAEANAIMYARRDLRGLTLYSTFTPCAACAGLIIQAGIRRVIAPIPPKDFAERWARDLDAALIMFNEAGVNLELVEERP